MSRIMERLILENTKMVTQEVTREVTREVTKEVTKSNATQTALRMLADDMTFEQVAKYSGLTIEEVKAIAARKTA